MSIHKKNNKFISYLIILIALFILILVTKNQIIMLQENLDLEESYNIELIDKKLDLKKLNDRKNKVTELSQDAKKYNIEIKEDEIIDYIYSYIEKTNGENGIVIIKNISISEAVDTEIGFKETKITLNLNIPNEYRLQKILNFLTGDKSKYKFFINSFSFPYGNVEGSFSVTIPLKILHK